MIETIFVEAAGDEEGIHMHIYGNNTSCPYHVPVFVLEHEQPYHAEAHLFKPRKDQRSVPCLSAIQHSRTSHINWTSWVKYIWVECRWP